MKKQSIRLIALAVILVMAIAIIPFSTTALPSVWDGSSAATSFGGGDGTKTTPYLINNANELAFLANSVNLGTTYGNMYIKLMEDIDLANKSWTPIAPEDANGFSGDFDGNGKTISGLNVDGTPKNGGLFGRCDGGTVRNLTVKGSLVNGASYSGGIIGKMTNGATIVNCVSEIDKVTGTSTGGVVGRASDGVMTYITGCVNKSTVQSSGLGNSFTGGIVGVAGNCEITYCFNMGNVSIDDAETGTYRLAGGIIGCGGATKTPSYVENCINTGNISTSPKATTYFAGGIIGRVSHVQFGTVENCISTGDVSVNWGSLTDKPEGKFGGLYGEVKDLATLTNNYTIKDVVCGTDYASAALVSVDNSKTLTLAAMSGNTAVTTLGLDATYWVAVTDGIPTIDFVKLYDEFLNPAVVTTTEPPLTTAPPTTTVKPTTTVPTTTTPTGTTKAPATSKAPEKTGCGKGGVIIAVAQVVAVIGGAAIVVTVKKR